MSEVRQAFGGNWTTEKLEHVRKYLVAYATIMNKQKFRFAYIDAFAGTGYRTVERDDEDQTSLLLPELADDEAATFIDGSARIALGVRPRFTKYIFIDRIAEHALELEKLKTEFPEAKDDIVVVNAEANAYLSDLCLNYKWRGNRAVLFLDPFGMQVKWGTIEAVAETEAIDMWCLFPLGVAVNRLLRRDGNISEAMRGRLDAIFGTSDWYNAFYETRTVEGLLGTESRVEKTVNLDQIGGYFVSRLKTIFASVAENPLRLVNSRNNPLYLLCFAAGNPKGAKTAVKIAQDILRR